MRARCRSGAPCFLERERAGLGRTTRSEPRHTATDCTHALASAPAAGSPPSAAAPAWPACAPRTTQTGRFFIWLRRAPMQPFVGGGWY
jgi:hypothetical protein